ncbi:MAG: WD40/YVTN/BNR-like repeat-containing protein, partial [Candidatus Angelobacter sp.]
MSNKFPLVRFIPLCTLLVLLSGFTFSQQLDPSHYSGLRWRMIGPHRGGRTIAVSGVEGQPNVYYFGGVGGGVWKTANGGVTWEPIFDGQPISSIGALAVASSNPSVIYVGTGEADFRSN